MLFKLRYSTSTSKIISNIYRSLASTSRNRTESPSEESSSSSTPEFDPRELLPRTPQSPAELIDFIRRNVVWFSEDFIASVKPYEISAYGKTWKALRREENRKRRATEPFDDWDEEERGRFDEDHGDDEEEFGFTVSTVLPQLKADFGGEDLLLGKTVPRFYQGPILFARNQKAKSRIVSALSRAIRRTDSPLTKALYVCVGKPKNEQGEGWCYSKKEYVGDTDTCQFSLHPTPSTPWNNAMKRGELTRGFFRYRQLAYDPDVDCSLVELELLKMPNQLDRLFLLDKGCPILGDSMNQVCNARILGRPVYVPPKKASIRNQYIPTGLLKKLRLSLQEYHSLPMFAHVYSITMPGLLGTKKKKEDVELRSPMPSYFTAILRALDWLRIVEEDERRREERTNAEGEQQSADRVQ